MGIAGLTLGGGLGILGRTHGLTSDQLVAAEVVLADGRVVDCDEHTQPDLFWALRGAGGGQLGVVTRFVLRTVPAPETTTPGAQTKFRSRGGRGPQSRDAWQSSNRGRVIRSAYRQALALRTARLLAARAGSDE